MSNPDLEAAIRPIRLSHGRNTAAEQLRHLIETQQFPRGSRLPSERKLAELLNVSRTMVREAISTLEATGLVEVRHGSGSYVTGEVSLSNLSMIWNTWYIAHRQDLLHLLQVREALECKAVALATTRAEPELAAYLRDILEEMRDASKRDRLDEVSRLDGQFHGAIIEASGNPILVQLLSSLNAVLADDRVAVFSLPGRLERSLYDHTRIVEAIEQHDPQAAQEALLEHFNSVIRDVESEEDVEPEE